MKRAVKRGALAGAALSCMFAIFIYLAQGPELEGMVNFKDAGELVESAVSRSNLRIALTKTVGGGRAVLPFLVGLKHAAKRMAIFIRLGEERPQYTFEYLVPDVLNKGELHCIVQISGDNVLGVSVHHAPWQTFEAARLRDNLKLVFPSYEILLLPSSAILPEA